MNEPTSHFETQADVLLSKMQKKFHPKAWEVLKIDLTNVRDWLIKRFEALGLSAEAEIDCWINVYNETHQLGIQSVKIITPTLLSGEIQEPTIGIIAQGLLEGSTELSIAHFSIDQGAEHVESLSDGGILLQAVETGAKLAPPHVLRHKQIAYAQASRQVMRVVLEHPKTNPVDAAKENLVQGYRNGVYVCTYLENTPEQRAELTMI